MKASAPFARLVLTGTLVLLAGNGWSAGEVKPTTVDLKSDESAPGATFRTLKWSYGLSLAAGLSSPMQKDFTDATAGVGYELDLLKSLGRRLAMRFTIGRSGLQEKDDINSAVDAPPLPPNLQVLWYHTDLVITRHFLSAQYSAPPIGPESLPLRFYFYAGLGAVNHRSTVVEEVTDTETQMTSTYVDKASITKFANTLGGGMILMLSRRVGVDFSVACDLVYAGEQPVYIDGASGRHYEAYNYDGVFDLKLGLVVLL